MKELKKYERLTEKKRELELRINSSGESEVIEISKELQQLDKEVHRYQVAFKHLTDIEKNIIKLRYDGGLSIIIVRNLLYMSKTKYYQYIGSIEAKLNSFFEGVKTNINLEKL